jgi:hypothetical protein
MSGYAVAQLFATIVENEIELELVDGRDFLLFSLFQNVFPSDS